MSSDSNSGSEKQVSAEEEDHEWLTMMSANESSQRWQRLLKDVRLGFVSLLCLLSYMYWPQPWVIVTGVAVIVCMAWLSEFGDGSGLLPARNRSVLITGCDTGDVVFVWVVGSLVECT